ncbi:MAG TPA: hypothetical protein VFW52_03175 [Candidatus Saccharimonadales bacterium]|nr:hypothetical protein [Candidatus Saccharimonadales bacterium]
MEDAPRPSSYTWRLAHQNKEEALLLDEQVQHIGDWLPGMAFWVIMMWLFLSFALSVAKRFFRSRKRQLP